MMRSETEITTGELVRLKRPRSIDDVWYMKTLSKLGGRFDRILVPYGTVLLYIGRLSSEDEWHACYHDASYDEAGYTPIVPWGWAIFSERDTLVAVNLSFVERV